MSDVIKKRSGKVAFMLVDDKFCRMRGFTEMSKSKNPVEYSRQYVDEDSERTDVTSYAESISFNLDYFENDTVHTKITEIFDNELVGDAARVVIAVVDMEKVTDNSCVAISRRYAVIPSSEGDSTEAYTYSGDFKASGEKSTITLTTTDDWQTATASDEAAAASVEDETY